MWAEVTCTERPNARECAAVSLQGDRMLTFGGMWSSADGNFVLSNEVHVFDAALRSWSLLETSGIVPRARTGHALVAIPGTQLVFAAYGLNHDAGYLSDICVLDVAARKWAHAGLNGQLPSARDKLAAAACGGHVFIHGGFGLKTPGGGGGESEDEEDDEDEDDGEGGRRSIRMGWHDDLFSLDPGTHSIRRLEPMGTKPAARAAHSLVANERVAGGPRKAGALWLFGGRTQAGRCNDLYELDVATVTWREVTPTGTIPAARSFHNACALSATRFVVFGGLDTADKHLDDLSVYDAAAQRWERITPPGDSGHRPSARASCALGKTADSFFVFGGSSNWVPEEGAPSTFYNDMHALPLSVLLADMPTRPRAPSIVTTNPSPVAGVPRFQAVSDKAAASPSTSKRSS